MTFRPFIDDGHGGPYSPKNRNFGTHDEMAVVRDDGSRIWRPDSAGLIEKDIVLDIDDRLHDSRGGLPFDVGRSRSFDIEMSQGERGRASMRHGASLVFSLHVNDNPDARARGAQLYIRKGNKKATKLARLFARPMVTVFGSCSVIEAWNDPDTTDDNWIDAPLSIIRAHAADVVLFELGFRKNEYDRKILMSELGREEIASMLRWCIAHAALEYGG